MKKFNHLIGTAAAAAALLLSIAACSNSFTPQASGQQQSQTQNNAQSTPVTLETPLTLEAAVAGAVVTFDNKAEGPVKYKLNGGEKQTIESGKSKDITLAAVGDKVEFFGDNKQYSIEDDYRYASNIVCSEDCYLYGNIMSLINSSNFRDLKKLEKKYTFFALFKGGSHIISKDGSDLLLPATTLTKACYYCMLRGCNITNAPALPATELEEDCYMLMFSACASLTVAPDLPANKLAESCYRRMFETCKKLVVAPKLSVLRLSGSCYRSMFYYCESLKEAPELPAASLADYCYDEMFYNCTSLESVTCLATNISASNCTTDWLKNVKSSGTFTKAAGTDWSGKTGASGIPSNWTVVDKQ